VRLAHQAYQTSVCDSRTDLRALTRFPSRNEFIKPGLLKCLNELVWFISPGHGVMLRLGSYDRNKVESGI
jgi:hypothetical protein